MPWSYEDYNYRAGPAGSLESLLLYGNFVRLVAEWSTGRRGSNPTLAYQHGEFPSPRKFHRAANLAMEVGLRYTDDTGSITHTDGDSGHAYENLSNLKRLFAGLQGQLVTLERTAPHLGTVTMEVEMLADAVPSQERHVFIFPLHAPKPFWTGAQQTATSPPTITPAGDGPIDDMVIDLVGGTDTRLTHDTSGAYVQIDGANPSGGVQIDVGAGTAVRITGGADYSSFLRVATPDWFELDPGANAVTVSGGGTASVDFNDKWR